MTCVFLVIPGVLADTGNYTPEPGTVLLLTVPDVRQGTEYTCGASALQAVLNYWGIDMREDELVELLNTTEESGTPPENIQSVAASLGLTASVEENLTPEQLEESIDANIPVIIAAQAWNGEYADDGTWISVTPESWNDTWEDGHYMVVIGIDDRNVYLEDPAQLGTRGVIPIGEFLSRWHDYDGGTGTGKPEHVYDHLGIIISGDEPASYPAYTPVT
ncbi:MAG: C39 family peptidase [Methanospirillum sp.]|nr:C39 family peptidase [Methanospirillum sp.]